MAKKKSNISVVISIIILLAAIATVIVLGIYLYTNNKTVYNDLPNANGNTAGNLQNGGYFCEYEGTVYFSNPFDKGKLYSMDVNQENVKKLNDESVSSINAYGKYLYFAKNNLTSSSSTGAFRGTLFAAVRCNTDGRNIVSLCDSLSGNLALIGNKIYFQHYENTDDKKTIGTLYSVGIDKADLKEVDDSEINPAGVSGSYIFYAGTEKDHNIYRFNSLTDSKTTFYEGNCYMCIPDGRDLYFIDADNNYALKKTNTSRSNNEAELVINEKIATYNVDSNYIYFQIDDKEGKLCRMKKNSDSSEYEVITTGHYEKINITSKHVYFYRVNDDSNVYYIPKSGPANVGKLSEHIL